MRGFTVLVSVLALGLTASSAAANQIHLELGDALYVGRIVDGIPSSPAAQAEYINYLITLNAGDGDTTFPESKEVYNREDSTLAGPLPTANPVTAVKMDLFGSLIVHPTGVVYILAKYAAANGGSLVWMVSGFSPGDTVVLPTHYNGHEISHYTLFTSVPDGGATLLLLGGALIGLGVLRRRFSE